MRALSSVSGGTSSRTVATRAECSEAAAANLPWLFSENSLSGPAILDPGAHQPPVEFWRGVRQGRQRTHARWRRRWRPGSWP